MELSTAPSSYSLSFGLPLRFTDLRNYTSIILVGSRVQSQSFQPAGSELRLLNEYKTSQMMTIECYTVARCEKSK